MNWRTDKPTADRIVAQIGKCSLHTGGYIVLELKQRPKPHYVDCNGVDVPEYAFIKWADLEEDETVTDCNDLEEEIKRYNRELWDRDTTLSNVARHFAKWGAEHTFTHHETDESLQEAVTHQMEDEQVIDDYVRRGLDDIVLKYAQLGAKWQSEQDHDACYQCEKAYDNVFFKGEQHAIKMMEKETISGEVVQNYSGEYALYIKAKLPKGTYLKFGDKVPVYIFKKNTL